MPLDEREREVYRGTAAPARFKCAKRTYEHRAERRSLAAEKLLAKLCSLRYAHRGATAAQEAFSWRI